MELTQRQLGFMRWLSLSPQREAYVSRSWTQTASELEALGLIALMGGCTGLLTSLSLAGVGFMAEQDGARHD